MKLTVHTFVSLDGVMQGPGGPDEDTSGGFTAGGWVVPYVDEGFGEIVNGWFTEADAFLLGGTTYRLFNSYWPQVTDPADPVAAKLNSLPKYVVSTTVTDPDWAGTTVVSEDVVARVAALKQADGRELQVHGSCALIHTLHDAGLVDEYRLIVFPVVIGQGKRLFETGSTPTSFQVTGSRATESGLLSVTLRPAGGLVQGDHAVVDGQDTPTL
jgi:dihydrofolate reductase